MGFFKRKKEIRGEMSGLEEHNGTQNKINQLVVGNTGNRKNECTSIINFKNINRVELIDGSNDANIEDNVIGFKSQYDKYDIKFDIQDDGKTLKIFKTNKQEEK